MTNTTTEQLKNHFRLTLSKFSHEIRNPISLINSELLLMVSTHPELADYQEWEEIMENMEYIRELLNDLSCYSNAGHIKLELTDLSSYLSSIISSVKPTFDYLGINFAADCPDSLPILPVDRIKLRQAILNLLRNAQEAVPSSGGKITFRSMPVHKLSVFLSWTTDVVSLLKYKKIFFHPSSPSSPQAAGLDLLLQKKLWKPTEAGSISKVLLIRARSSVSSLLSLSLDDITAKLPRSHKSNRPHEQHCPPLYL